jgi:predicted nucleic acid-binding Zn ribbon protein
VRRRAPRALGAALERLTTQLAPQTPLAAIQQVWPESVGEEIAAQTVVSGERDGVVTVRCTSAVWASELNLMAATIIARLNQDLGDTSVRELRCIIK